MAKRFIDTDIFKKQFIRSLKAPYKVLWIYILTDCNHSGIWEADFDVAQLRLGVKVSKQEAEQIFSEKIIVLDDGGKWFIPSFIDFQYGKLSAANRAHNSVILLLTKYNLLNADLSIKELNKPLASPLQGDKDMDKEKEQEKDKDKEVIQPKIEKSELEIAFDNWIEMRKKMKGGISDHAIELGKSELKKLAGGNVNLAIEIINQSILNSWKGFFQIKNVNNGIKKTGHDIEASLDIADRILRGEITDPNFTGYQK